VYLQFQDTRAPHLLELCIPPSNGIVRWWLFPEFGVELPLDNCTPTIILNNPVYMQVDSTRFINYKNNFYPTGKNSNNHCAYLIKYNETK